MATGRAWSVFKTPRGTFSRCDGSTTLPAGFVALGSYGGHMNPVWSHRVWSHRRRMASAAAASVVRRLRTEQRPAFIGVSAQTASPVAGLPSPWPAGRSPPVVPVT